VAITSVGVVVIPATAYAEEVPVRYERACLRIPNLELRTQTLIDRINGDAVTRGSLAWLNARLAEAQAAGRTQLVTVLENRLTVRTRTLEILTQRQVRLAELRTRCIEHGVEL
jgi:predicted nucleotidyltransferase